MKRIARQRKTPFPIKPRTFTVIALALSALLAACSFNYGDSSGDGNNRPDIVMENLEYVRIRGGDPQVRFQAEHAERWEDRQIMDIRNFVFEQLEDQGETVNVMGNAGAAQVQLNSGNVSLYGGVQITVESEDIVIRTEGLEWQDKERILSGRGEAPVDIERSDGTDFKGWGFFADARNWSWTFMGGVEGTYVEKDEEKAPEEETADEEDADDDEAADDEIAGEEAVDEEAAGAEEAASDEVVDDEAAGEEEAGEEA